MKASITVFFIAACLLAACGHPSPAGPKIEKGMTKVTILYPAGEGKTFDWDYYLNKHAPLLTSLLGDSLKLLTIDKVISGRVPDSPAVFVAMFNMYFETPTAYPNSFGPHAQEIVADVKNYTNIQPIVQISVVQ